MEANCPKESQKELSKALSSRKVSKETFPKNARLRKRADFLWMKKKGNTHSGHFLNVDLAHNEKGAPRLGITVSRKMGKANERNRFKRCVREAFRKQQSFYPKGTSIHVRPKGLITKVSFQDCFRELLQAVLGENK